MTRKQSYCCYGSKLVRILNEQGKAQLGMRWGKAKEPDCEGSFLDRTSARQTTGVRNSSGSESSAGYRSGENLQRFDNQSLDSRDGISESDRISGSSGNQQTNIDRLETTRGGNIGISGTAGRGNSGGRPRRGSGAGINAGAQTGINGGRLRTCLLYTSPSPRDRG